MARPIQESQATTIIQVVDFNTLRASRGWFFALGAAFVVLGVLSIILPFIASLVTTIVIGWLMLLGGLFQGYHAVRNRGWAGSGWALASAAIQVVAGVLVVLFPVVGTLSLTLVLAAYFIIEGAFKLVRAVQHRRMPAWGWLMFDGVLSLALGILILALWPSTAVWVIGLLVGINLLFSGTSLLLIGLSAGSAVPARP